MKKLGLLVIFALALGGCVSTGSSVSGGTVEIGTLKDTDKKFLKSEKISKFLVENPSDFKKYNNVLIYATQFNNLKISPKTNIAIAKSWNKSSWKEMDEICQDMDVFAHKIFKASKDFTPQKKGSDNALALQIELLEFMPYKERYADADLGTVGTSSSIHGLGEVSFRAILANSKTGELVAVVEDTRQLLSATASRISDANSKFAYNMVWRKTFNAFIEELHDDMLRLKRAENYVERPMDGDVFADVR